MSFIAKGAYQRYKTVAGITDNDTYLMPQVESVSTY